MRLRVNADEGSRRKRSRTKMIRSSLRFCVAALAFVPVAASAHVGVGDTHGFAHGFSHPFSGIDHVLAMVAVGLLAARLGGQALWLLSLSFVSVMALAGMAGMSGIELPFVEVGISVSVVVLGLAVAFQFSVPTLVATTLVGFFAIFHGHAHGVEMPDIVSGLSYGAGFVCATAVLHAIGIGLGRTIGKTGVYGRRIVQIAGSGMVITGVAILTLS
jgi:urease accessory protein